MPGDGAGTGGAATGGAPVRSEIVHLRAGGCSLVLDARGPGLPAVLHWGAGLGEPPAVTWDGLAEATVPALARSTLDHVTPRSLLRQHAEGHLGRPGLSGHRDGHGWSPLFTIEALDHTDHNRVTARAVDPVAQLALRSEVELSPSGLLRMRHRLRNDGDLPYELEDLTAALPLPAQATELLDFSGHWCRERQPRRHPLAFGAWVRENRRGRTGHDATIGLLAGTPGFDFGHGEVWAVHVGWSGNHVTYAERWPSGDAVLGGGELVLPGEVRLAPGEDYVTPWVYAAYSSHGLDGIRRAFHRYLRARPHHPGPDRPRPVILDTWEAVYFDHDPDRLRALADAAASIGVERFVLDDGWFRGRRDDRAGLGDWYADDVNWPQGLGPLIDHVRSLGMDFGLWVEPEMVSPDSDLYRAHPDWILKVEGREPLTRRRQHVLDLVNPSAYRYVRERLDALLSGHDIAFLKWDHNRDLIDAGHGGRPGVRLQTLATYRLLDEVRADHPGIEIESCSSGGARIDLGILERSERVWASDSNDALERQSIQRWTGLFIPPELVGTHVGPPRALTSGRVHALSFRAATSLFGHAGIEWDISSAPSADLTALAAWIDFYKRQRRLLHTGDVIDVDHPDPAATLHGVVAQDRSEALYLYVQLATSSFAVPAPARLRGLDPTASYRVAPVHPVAPPLTVQQAAPPWYSAGGVTLAGSALGSVGLTLPVLAPEQALLLQVSPADR